MYLCYIDESGTSSIPGNTSHFILAGLSIPIWHWRDCDREIEAVKKKYELGDSEIHIAWLLRPYLEQTKIYNFDTLDYSQRKAQASSLRKAELFRLQKEGKRGAYKQAKKNFKNTEGYLHLSYLERKQLALEIAQRISQWGFARLFAEYIDKVYFDPSRAPHTIDEQSFEQLVSRFEQYLQKMGHGNQSYGLLIHDVNETVERRHTQLTKQFLQRDFLDSSELHYRNTLVC